MVLIKIIIVFLFAIKWFFILVLRIVCKYIKERTSVWSIFFAKFCSLSKQLIDQLYVGYCNFFLTLAGLSFQGYTHTYIDTGLQRL